MKSSSTKNRRARNRYRLPRVTIKFAQTIDGRLATATGDSKWISSEPARKFGHKLRSAHEAILVGVGTVLADDPQLNVRLVKGRDPIRVIVDSKLRTPPGAKLLSNNNSSRTLIAASAAADPARARRLRSLGAEVVRVPSERGGAGIRLDRLLEELGRRGIESVLVEGGSQIITSLLAAGLADRLVVVIAPKIVGEGVESIGDLGIARVTDAVRFSSFKIKRLGPDVIFDAMLERHGKR
jgi:riboflavin-specific deaminase-like protein